MATCSIWSRRRRHRHRRPTSSAPRQPGRRQGSRSPYPVQVLLRASPSQPRPLAERRTAWRRCSGSMTRSEEHTSELQSHSDLVCRLLLEKKKKVKTRLCFLKKTTTKTEQKI